ncbi:unnamed protein product [Dibothriocephalus latus]|uniref:PI3K/PI4K catalytic domain-containing protein n=1 Tax=Dibothriocephalus latus TaxID=60516 RepID=A0A3P7PG31_DIBLA|nr:unnamed protein product [Dibothriocephalus latus]
MRVEFGPSGAKLHTLTPAELNDCLRRVDAAFTSSLTSDHSSSADPSSRQQSRPSLNDFSLWLASFDETQDLNVELPGPKVIRILGSDGVWSNWMVKSGEDLRQDSRIQHLFHFANHALARAPTGKHQPIPSKSDGAVDNQTSTLLLRTYLVLPVTSQLGLLRWIPDTKTVAGFCKSAMRASEVTLYNGPCDYFNVFL